METLSTSPTGTDQDPTPKQLRIEADRNRVAEINDFQGRIEDFSDNCNDFNQIRSVLRTLNRATFPQNVAASLYQQPQDQALKNPIQDNMEAGERACKTLLKKAFSFVETLADINKIMACDYRIAGLNTKETETSNGSLLYGLPDEILRTLKSNINIRTEIVKARDPKHKRNEAFLHFLYFAKEVEAFDIISPVLLELQTEAFGGQVENIVNQYR